MESPRPDWSESREPWQRAQDYDEDVTFGPELPFWRLFIIAMLVTLFVVALLGWFFRPTPARAHEAKSGWAYPLECCSNRDCREVTGSAVEERDGGFVIRETGERIAYRDPRLRVSPDGVIHWCSAAGAADGRTICLFMPPRSF